jgi:hypothetical protein
MILDKFANQIEIQSLAACISFAGATDNTQEDG